MLGEEAAVVCCHAHVDTHKTGADRARIWPLNISRPSGGPGHRPRHGPRCVVPLAKGGVWERCGGAHSTRPGLRAAARCRVVRRRGRLKSALFWFRPVAFLNQHPRNRGSAWRFREIYPRLGGSAVGQAPNLACHPRIPRAGYWPALCAVLCWLRAN